MSSYERVYNLLLNTADGLAIQEKIRLAYEDARLTGHRFDLVSPREGEGNPSVRAIFSCSFHKDARFTLGQGGGARLWPSRIHTDSDGHNAFRYVAMNNFGSKVGTFYCKRETVLDGCKGQRGRKEFPSFADWASSEMEAKFADARKDAEERLNVEAAVIEATDEFKAEAESALVRFAMNEVGQVLGRYSFLGREVLSEALREHSISEVLTL